MILALQNFFLYYRKFLLLNLLIRNMKVKYRGSLFGYFWTLLVPFVQVVIFYYLYQVILKIPVPNYLAFVVSGLLPWYFLSSTITESLEALVAGEELITQVPVPIQSFPAATVLVNILNFVVSFPILIGVLWFSGVPLTWNVLWFLPLCGILFLFTYGLAFLLASLFVVLRDLRYILSLALQVWFYATPILYPVHMIPEKFRWILDLNPVAGFFVNARLTLIDGQPLNWMWVGHLSCWALVTLTLAIVICQRYSYKLVEKL